MKNKLILLVLLGLVSIYASSQNYRYVNTLFPAPTITNNVVYANAPFLNSQYNDEANTTSGDLIMDIYQPAGDTLTKRPVIVFAHGGGFVDGNKNVDDMVAFCDSFARKGYVTVSIDYRQGVEVYDNGDLHYTRAAYRGLQDGRSAIRFLRANALTYGIDTNKIYWGGNSAGSFIGLNSIFMDASEKPTYANSVTYTITVLGIPTTYNGPDLGNIDNGENLSFGGRPNAVMSCWGGVGDTLDINSNNDTPVFLVHGTADAIVDFNSGAPFGLSGISPVFGSNSINTRLNNVGIPAEMTYFVPGEDHEFYGVTNGTWDDGTGGNEYWDTVVVKATSFYYMQHKPTADFTYSATNLAVDFTDASSGVLTWLWSFGDGNTSNLQNPPHTYTSAGDYTVALYIENDITSWDTISYDITVDTSVEIKDLSQSNIKIYPNPATNNLQIFFNETQLNKDYRIVNITGQTVRNSSVDKQLTIINISDLPAGIYFVRIDNTFSKFVKK